MAKRCFTQLNRRAADVDWVGHSNPRLVTHPYFTDRGLLTSAVDLVGIIGMSRVRIYNPTSLLRLFPSFFMTIGALSRPCANHLAFLGKLPNSNFLAAASSTSHCV